MWYHPAHDNIEWENLGGQDAHCRAYRNSPVLELTPQDRDTLIGELRTHNAIYRPLFQRREQRA
jgi:hypothetical protein